jgi:hypothetical protein
MKKLLCLLSISFVFINIFGVLIYFSFNSDFYINHFDNTQITNPNLPDLQNAYSFIQNKADLNSNFSPLETSHLQDVQDIFTIIHYILLVSIILFGIITWFLIYRHKYNLIFKWLFIWSIISLSVILVLLLLTLIDFTYTFQIFHKLLFPQWNREFAEDSRLITLFPESFFIAISRSIFITISTISIFIITFYLIIKKILRKQNLSHWKF